MTSTPKCAKTQAVGTRDDFSAGVKDKLAKRVGLLCSRPECACATTGPKADPGGAINIGVAAHITAAAAGGPRYDPLKTSAQRRSIENAIWLCQSCAKLIDSDPNRYSTVNLRAWKEKAEAVALERLTRTGRQNSDESGHRQNPAAASSSPAPRSSRYASSLEAFEESYIAPNTSSRVPFGGREAEAAALDHWLNQEAASSYLLIAPGGRGKSALLIQWAQKIASMPKPFWHVVFAPISMRFGTNLPHIFFEIIATGLADAIGATVDPPRSDPEEYYREKCRTLIDQAVRQDIPVLLLIDGIDEAAGGRFDGAWIPRRDAKLLRIVFTARPLAGDGGADAWIARLRWSDRPGIFTATLQTLDDSAVKALLVSAGAPLDAIADDSALVTRLITLSAGEPLVLRLYVEDLWGRSGEGDRLTIDDLNRIKPGLSGYFQEWMDRQTAAWSAERRDGKTINEDVLNAYLAILACAYGPLTSGQLGRLAF